jgi:thiopeptide-type bacteriocin biosynthesis protein
VIASGVRTRFGLQTYERELERYGGPETAAVCEALACVDSSAVRALVRATRSGSERSEVDRVELGLVSAADLLASLVGDDPVERARWAKGLAGGANEGGAVFRERKIRLRALVQATDDSRRGDGGSWSTAGDSWSRVGVLVAEVLTRRRAAMAPLAAELRTRWADGTGFRSPEELAASIVHLHANRLGLDRLTERVMLAHEPRSAPERRPTDRLGSAGGSG